MYFIHEDQRGGYIKLSRIKALKKILILLKKNTIVFEIFTFNSFK